MLHELETKEAGGGKMDEVIENMDADGSMKAGLMRSEHYRQAGFAVKPRGYTVKP
jgi:hypothetical protein